MKIDEIKFLKYKTKGADYHYREINKYRVFSFNAFLFARYENFIYCIEEYVLKIKDKERPLKILDVGCGDAVLFYLMKKKFENVNLLFYGTDLSREAISVAKRKNGQGIFKVANAYMLPFKSEEFDIVISTDVIEHVNHPRKMISEMCRVLKKKCLVVVGTPIKYTERPLDSMHVHEFFPEEFVGLMSNYFRDCKIIKTHDLIPHYLYLSTVNIWKYKFTLWKYFFNLLNIFFGWNIFLSKRKNIKYPSYMFVKGFK